ncbi:phosphoribosylanthranilate isomerase [Pseudonocardiaceae bacterium YIM PH 21723]|nr:phosphoribosylanthranilate isomerase [Pseudonocardiaceae bacterium YIM PH 21723]
MFVKVCGLRTAADVAVAVEAGADAIGFVLTESPRQIDSAAVRELIKDIAGDVLTVGVVRGITAEDAGRLADEAGVAALQLHGDYTRADFAALGGRRLIRATSLKPDTDLATGAYGEELFLLDSPVAGSGERWDLGRLDGSRPTGKWLLAGGLSPENVRAAISVARPWGVDVSSGVESSRGVKDHGKIRAFVAAARSSEPAA